eukprot:1487954-Ditylum_brightwellii.AAC.1
MVSLLVMLDFLSVLILMVRIKPDCDKVLHAIASDHCNVTYLDPDIKFAPGSVDDTIISASTGVPTWEPVVECCDPTFWSDADPDY